MLKIQNCTVFWRIFFDKPTRSIIWNAERMGVDPSAVMFALLLDCEGHKWTVHCGRIGRTAKCDRKHNLWCHFWCFSKSFDMRIEWNYMQISIIDKQFVCNSLVELFSFFFQKFVYTFILFLWKPCEKVIVPMHRLWTERYWLAIDDSLIYSIILLV